MSLEKYAKENNKQVITSVVWTPKENWTIYDLAQDYAFLARSAEFRWSKIIELNFSCPNVQWWEWSIYKDIENSLIIAKNTRKFLHNSDTKLLIKMWFSNRDYYKEFLENIASYIDGIVAINTIPMQIIDKDNKQALAWWIISWTCWRAILDLWVKAVYDLRNARDELLDIAKHVKIIGCGWVMDAEWFMRHIDAWAEFVMCATAALFNPELPLQIAKYLNKNKIKRKI
jgi:dihydroorotate dehydrogenase